ncbi:hypothetical protein Bbelb_194720 [Branchiostoma belcheri]|nr:hypothetical protein Bbelb_194720 [Branchiostoma belcheri]
MEHLDAYALRTPGRTTSYHTGQNTRIERNHGPGGYGNCAIQHMIGQLADTWQGKAPDSAADGVPVLDTVSVGNGGPLWGHRIICWLCGIKHSHVGSCCVAAEYSTRNPEVPGKQEAPGEMENGAKMANHGVMANDREMVNDEGLVNHVATTKDGAMANDGEMENHGAMANDGWTGEVGSNGKMAADEWAMVNDGGTVTEGLANDGKMVDDCLMLNGAGMVYVVSALKGKCLMSL